MNAVSRRKTPKLLIITTELIALFTSVFFLTIFAGISLNSSAQEHHEEHADHHEDYSEDHSEGGSFDAGEMIMHHISDAHEIHIIGDLAIYLPIILYTDNGLEVFSSSHFYLYEEHGQFTKTAGEDESFHYYTHGDYVMFHEHIYYRGDDEVITIDPETGAATNAAVFDLSITKSVAGVLLTCLLLILIFSFLNCLIRYS